jgi:hypothetical protein
MVPMRRDMLRPLFDWRCNLWKKERPKPPPLRLARYLSGKGTLQRQRGASANAGGGEEAGVFAILDGVEGCFDRYGCGGGLVVANSAVDAFVHWILLPVGANALFEGRFCLHAMI